MNLSFVRKLVLAGATLAVSAFALVSLGTSSANATSCVAGTKYTDFKGSIVSKDTMSISTKNGGKLCNDVKVNFASFVAPANYNGKGFKNNPTAIPQSQFAVKTVTLKKGTTGSVTVTVPVPDACTNYQIDAYLGAVQTKITTSAGIVGTNAITGKLFQKTKSDCSVPKVKACNINTGLYEMVEKGKENVAPYTTNFDNCEMTKACNLTTGIIEPVTKEKAKGSNYTDNFDKCEKTDVCNIKTGDIDTVTKEEAKDTSKYADASSDKCKDIPTPPVDIPSTGPTEIVSGIAGIGSLAGAGSMYFRSRRALRR